jgi:hypothetical protein
MTAVSFGISLYSDFSATIIAAKLLEINFKFVTSCGAYLSVHTSASHR